MSAKSVKKMVRKMIVAVKDANAKLANGMPTIALTPGQKILADKHGTPKEFAEACIQTIGEVSPAEAEAAINKYRDEWVVA